MQNRLRQENQQPTIQQELQLIMDKAKEQVMNEGTRRIREMSEDNSNMFGLYPQ